MQLFPNGSKRIIIFMLRAIKPLPISTPIPIIHFPFTCQKEEEESFRIPMFRVAALPGREIIVHQLPAIGDFGRPYLSRRAGETAHVHHDSHLSLLLHAQTSRAKKIAALPAAAGSLGFHCRGMLQK